MAWTDSRVFSAFITDAFNRTAAFDLNSDTFNVVLFDSTITPDNEVVSADTGYNTGVWLTSAEVDDTTEWDAGGEPLTSVTSVHATGTYTFDAANTASGGSSATLSDVNGVLIIDDTLASPVADQGLCYNWAGGPNAVVNGTFTVQYGASGILLVTTSS